MELVITPSSHMALEKPLKEWNSNYSTIQCTFGTQDGRVLFLPSFDLSFPDFSEKGIETL
jgi:hypothetical protein